MRKLLFCLLALGCYQSVAQNPDRTNVVTTPVLTGQLVRQQTGEYVSLINRVEAGGKASYTAGKSVFLLPGFVSGPGSVMLAKVVPGGSGPMAMEPGLAVLVLPNPFVEKVEVRYALPEASVVSHKLLDAAGRVISVWKGERQEAAGSHLFRFSGTALAGGLYFYVLETEKQVQSVRLLKQP